MKRVITYGTFDLLHYGHINLLRRAKALGDYLIVVVSSDEFNWKEKHKKTYFTYEQRKQLLEAIRYVDLPLSILEAMACGLPIVATRVGGVVDIVSNNINGYIVQSDNLNELEEALEELIISETKRFEYGKESRRISEEWSLNACVKGYEELQ